MWESSQINEIIKIKEMFSFFEQEYPKGFDFKGEIHNFWECLYVIDGSICVFADDRMYRIGKNQLVFHKPLEFHKFHIDECEKAKILVFSFSIDGELEKYFENKVFTLSQQQKYTIDSLLKYVRSKTDAKPISLKKPFSKRFMVPFSTDKTYSQMTLTYIYQLLLSLADSGEVLSECHSKEADTFEKAVSYMNANTHGSVSVEEVSNYCNVSQSTLKRIFTRHTGIGIHKYFLQLKLKHATELLLSGEGVCSVAEKLGFSSQAYFSSAYRRETGKNPSEIGKQRQVQI